MDASTPPPPPAPQTPPGAGTPPAPLPATAPEKKSDHFTDGSYIRTFAKDYEKITGKPAPGGKIVVPKKEMSPPKPQKTLEEELAPTTEGALAEARDMKSAKKQSAFSIDGARSEILERLKASVKIKPELPKREEKVSPPKVVIPPPAPPPPPPPPPPMQLKEKKDEFLSPLHTFKTDFSEKVGRESASKISILAAESDSRKPTRTKVSKQSDRNPIPVIVGIVLLFGGGAGIYFAFQFAKTTPPVPQHATVPSLIFADATKEVSGKGGALMQELDAVAGTPIPDKNVVITYLSGSSAGATSTVSIPLPGGALVAALSLSAPDILLRNVADESTVGVVRSGSETRPFFILRVSSFERAFAGMLQWEGTIARELKTLYPAYQTSPFIDQVGTSTEATSTIPKGQTLIIPHTAAPQGFVDEVVSNHDVRILYDAQHRSILLYGFRDKNTLIIARDKAAFSTLSDRLSASR